MKTAKKTRPIEIKILTLLMLLLGSASVAAEDKIVVEVMDALDTRPGTIAITNLGSNFRHHNNIKAIAVNGVFPSSETLKSEKYNFYHEPSTITLGEPQGLAKRFLDYLNTTDGQDFLASRGAFGLR